MDDNRNSLKIRHSLNFQESTKSNSAVYSKSDLYVALSNKRRADCSKILKIPDEEDYYKRYEHDEVPVKDNKHDEVPVKDNTNKSDSRIGSMSLHKKSLTNSDLEKMETRIFQNVSQELQTDEYSVDTLESNIKFFKTTVEKIFDNFYTSMRDFEHYKRRFHEILDKSKEGSIDDMKNFINDMFENIMSTENSISHTSRNSTVMEDCETCVAPSSCGDASIEANASRPLLEAYKNENYSANSTQDKNSSTKSSKIEEIFNIFLLGGNPDVHITMNDRNLLSEINIREPDEIITTGATTSADNLKKLAAKKMEVERYIKQQDHNIPDRNIPVKISYAKKNIYLNEDFARNDNSENSKSLISKICSIICKKFRKSTFG